MNNGYNGALGRLTVGLLSGNNRYFTISYNFCLWENPECDSGYQWTPGEQIRKWLDGGSVLVSKIRQNLHVQCSHLVSIYFMCWTLCQVLILHYTLGVTLLFPFHRWENEVPQQRARNFPGYIAKLRFKPMGSRAHVLNHCVP